MMPQSLYVHIPFCKHICAYCDFAKVFYDEAWADAYLNMLEEELKKREANRPFQTVYIGGGSPSALSESQLVRLFQILEKPLSAAIEATMEINPEDLTFQKSKIMKAAGINRVSMGVQTFDEALLQRLGRHHTYQDVENAVQFLKNAGIQRISFDFIYGLPNQTLAHLKRDLDMLEAFPQVSHLSFYTLILEEHTRFYNENIHLMQDDWLIGAQKLIIDKLHQLGFERYEVSNYAKSNQKSLHNLVYWHNQRYVGIGCGASGYIDDIRYDNTKSLQQYLKGTTTYTKEELDKEEQMFEELMLGLRLTDGIELSQFEDKYGVLVQDVYQEQIKQYEHMGLLIYENGRLKTTSQGMDVLDEILVSLMA